MPQYRKHTFDMSYFNEINTEDKAYFLGLLYADGCNFEPTGMIRLSLVAEDGYILEVFREKINLSSPLQRLSKRGSRDQLLFAFNSREVSKKLSKLGCMQAKTFKIKFPSEDIVPKHLQSHFIRGYFDGDGCAHIDKRHQIIFKLVGTYNFCKGVQDIFIKELGCNKTKISKNGKVFILTYGGNRIVKRIKEYLYTEATIYLKRKYDKIVTGITYEKVIPDLSGKNNPFYGRSHSTKSKKKSSKTKKEKFKSGEIVIWNKGKKMLKSAWNKGLTTATNDSVRKNIENRLKTMKRLKRLSLAK